MANLANRLLVKNLQECCRLAFPGPGLECTRQSEACTAWRLEPPHWREQLGANLLKKAESNC